MYYAYSTIKAPDKGEVGGSSPPRPTIQIASKYAAILTFPLSGISVKKPICQLFANFRIGRMTCKAVQVTARLWKKREVIFSQFAGA